MPEIGATLDHRALLGRLTRAERAALLRRSDLRGGLQLGAHLAAVAAAGTWVASGAPGWPLALPPLGVLTVFLFAALHECTHRTAFRTEAVNRCVAAAAGFLLLLPPEWFRCFHAAHHRFTRDPDRDPELAAPEPRTPGRYALHLTGLPLWRSAARVLVANALGRCGDRFVPPGSRAAVAREARLFLAGYAALAAGSALLGTGLLLWIWVVPALLGQPFLRACLLAEHAGCPRAADMLANSRTTLTAALVRRLAWNMPYHAEHHAHPAVPFHALPRLHALAAAHLKSTERGYARFHRRFAASLAGR